MKMSSVCRICLASNRSLQSLNNNVLRSFYEKLTNAKFNSEDARPRALCCFCYQKLLRCHTFSQMALRSEKIFNHLYESGLEVTTEGKLNMKQHLSVVTMPFIIIDVNATNVGSQVTIKDEPLSTDIGIKEEVTTEPDTLPDVDSFSFQEDISDPENDTEEHFFNTHIEQSKPDDSSFTIKDEPLSSIKEGMTTELDKRGENEPFPKHSTKSPLSFKEDNSDQERDVEEVPHKIQFEKTKQDHSKMPFSCKNCNKIFHIKSKLISHISNSHSKVKRKQYSSTRKHTETTNMIADKTKYSQKKKLACHVCDKTYVNKSNLFRHIQIHRGEKSFTCNVCNKQFKRKDILVKHLRTHTGEKPFACIVCDKRFIQKSILVIHMKIHTGEKPFACNVCDKQFIQKSHLLSHKRKHTGEKPFACPACDKRFIKKSSLVSHMRTHTGEKPFTCHVCDKQFNRKSTLDSHIRTHTGEKPFACHVCDKRFNQKCTLISHMRTHTGEKPFTCHVCDKQFNQNGTLISHMRTHTGEKPSPVTNVINNLTENII